MKELIQAMQKLKDQLDIQLRDFILKVQEDTVYFSYQFEDIDMLVDELTLHNYKIIDNDGVLASNHTHFLVDTKIKRVEFISDQWIDIVQQEQIPILPIVELPIILSFYQE